MAAAFDRIAHDHILAMLGTFPARGMIAQWLKAGVVEQGRLHRTEEGTPQGGVVSPVLLNVALHGMEQAAGVRYQTTGKDASQTVMGSPVLIRYADDLVALCHTRQEAFEVKARLAEWLAPRGLAFNEDKTRVVTLDEGFDFLGFNVRRYRGKLLIKPSKAAISTDPGKATHRDAVPARDQRSGGDQTAQPDHPGLGRLLPDSGIQRGIRRAGRLPVEAHLEMGDLQPPEQAEVLGRSPVLRQVQQVQARPVGVRRPHKRRLHAQVRLDQDRPTPDRQATERHPTTPPWPTTGPSDGARRPCRSTTPPCGSTRPARSLLDLRSTLSAVEDPPQTPREWEHWLTTTRKAIVDRDARRRHVGQDATPSHTRPAATTAAARHFCPPDGHQGLLEPDAGKRASPVLRGARRARRRAPSAPSMTSSLGVRVPCGG